MKTFEVYSLYDVAYRSRRLVAAVQADRFQTDGYTIAFYKDTFFNTRQIGEVCVGGAFSVLDTEFSMTPDTPNEPDTTTDTRFAGIFNAELPPAPSAKPRRRRSKASGDLLVD